jgi:hypothetical protein
MHIGNLIRVLVVEPIRSPVPVPVPVQSTATKTPERPATTKA